MNRLTITLFILFGILSAQAQRPVRLAYYDVDRLYDTIPALFYNDDDFTPHGRLQWNTERYHRKIRHTAAVLDSMHMDLIAVAGVENEQVVRDLTAACRTDYCYIHRTINGFDGLDIALLYFGDRFSPVFTNEGRGWIYVEGELDGNPIGLLLCRNARYAGEALDDIRDSRPNVPLIAAGRFKTSHAAPHTLTDALARAEHAGRGNVRYTNGWRMRERILTDTLLHPATADVYARHWLFDMQTGAPLPTYSRTTYRGGYGEALPLFVVLHP